MPFFLLMSPFAQMFFFSLDFALWHHRCHADESFANFDPIRCVGVRVLGLVRGKRCVRVAYRALNVQAIFCVLARNLLLGFLFVQLHSGSESASGSSSRTRMRARAGSQAANRVEVGLGTGA